MNQFLRPLILLILMKKKHIFCNYSCFGTKGSPPKTKRWQKIFPVILVYGACVKIKLLKHKCIDDTPSFLVSRFFRKTLIITTVNEPWLEHHARMEQQENFAISLNMNNSLKECFTFTNSPVKGPHEHWLQFCDGDVRCSNSIHLFQEQKHEKHHQLLHDEYGIRRFFPALRYHGRWSFLKYAKNLVLAVQIEK